MKTKNINTIEGKFQNIVFSPNGNIEGVLLMVDGKPRQIVFEAFQPHIHQRFENLPEGTEVVVEATERDTSQKGIAVHPVFDLVEVISIDGESSTEGAEVDTGYSGKVVRLNYAKHGEPNGVVLDTGDFIHLRPKGFAKLKLKVGSTVKAEGDAHQLVTGHGWAVEARSVNGIAMD